MSEQTISALALQQQLLDSRELAVLDVREARAFNQAHLNLARHAPLSTLPLRITALVPRRTTPIILIDDNDGAAGAESAVAARAAQLLQGLGYPEVRRLAGGLQSWIAQGLPVIDGYNTLIKAFGDIVRQHYRTPTLSVGQLRQRQQQGLATTVIDARPRAEYEFLSIAGARNYPGTELALRQFPQRDPQHLWVINCFSRTRGIIGTTTLKLLGLTEQAAFVEDGVMAWALQGGAVVQQAEAPDDIPALPDTELQRLANDLRSRYDLRRIDASGLRHLREAGDRSLYVFDLRPGSIEQPATSIARAVAGGQLLMHFENFIGTRNARIVLIDDPHRLRATLTAFWLTQLNQAEIYILDDTLAPAALAPLPVPVPENAATTTATSITATTLLQLYRDREAEIIDVSPSIDFERAHIPGARFLLPASLTPLTAIIPSSRRLVFTSTDGVAAQLVAQEAAARWPQQAISWLQNGNQGWQQSGQQLQAHYASAELLTPFDDDWNSVMRIFGPRRNEAWVDYLQWEKTFSARVISDTTVRFALFAAD